MASGRARRLVGGSATPAADCSEGGALPISPLGMARRKGCLSTGGPNTRRRGARCVPARALSAGPWRREFSVGFVDTHVRSTWSFAFAPFVYYWSIALVVTMRRHIAAVHSDMMSLSALLNTTTRDSDAEQNSIPDVASLPPLSACCAPIRTVTVLNVFVLTTPPPSSSSGCSGSSRQAGCR